MQQEYRELFSQCDLVLLGMEQRQLESYFDHINGFKAVVAFVASCRPRRILLGHHHPFYPDETLLELLEDLSGERESRLQHLDGIALGAVREEEIYHLDVQAG